MDEDTNLSLQNISVLFDNDIIYGWLQLTITCIYGIFNVNGDESILVDNKTIIKNDTDKTINNVIQNISYIPPLNFNEQQNDIEIIKVNILDNTRYSQQQKILVFITSVNDSPVITLNSSETFYENNDGLIYIQVSDVDFDFKWVAQMQVVLQVFNGSISLKSRRGLYFPNNYHWQNTQLIHFISTMKNVNTLLNGVVYHPTTNLLSATKSCPLHFY